MKVNITARKVHLKDNFKERVDKKLGKFNRIFSENVVADVVVTVEKHTQKVEVTIKDKGLILRGESSCNEMNQALDNVIDNLGRQIRKHKTKLEKKLHSASLEDFLKQEQFINESVNKDESYVPVRVKHFEVKPLMVEEAILQMNMLGHKFFMFKNNETNQMNLVYIRKDGTYGLLEPEN